MEKLTKSDIRLQQEKYNEKQDVVLLTYIDDTENCEKLYDFLKKAVAKYLQSNKKKKDFV